MRRGTREEGGGEKGGGGRRIVRRKVTSAANPAHRLQDTGAERCTQKTQGQSLRPVFHQCFSLVAACMGVHVWEWL